MLKSKFLDILKTFSADEISCTLTISGTKKEVLKAALRHAVEEHGHKDTPELRRILRIMLKEENYYKTK